jgi:hypothetical protein
MDAVLANTCARYRRITDEAFSVSNWWSLDLADLARYDAYSDVRLVSSGAGRRAMMIRLPGGDQAILDIRKIEDYCLNPMHPRGRHKARVFREALGIQRTDAAWLRQILLEAAGSSEALELAADMWGSHWRIDVAATRHGKSVVVRTIWIVRTGEIAPRFVTCWVL